MSELDLGPVEQPEPEPKKCHRTLGSVVEMCCEGECTLWDLESKRCVELMAFDSIIDLLGLIGESLETWNQGRKSARF